jgi:hypothetical protein
MTLRKKNGLIKLSVAIKFTTLSDDMLIVIMLRVVMLVVIVLRIVI